MKTSELSKEEQALVEQHRAQKAEDKKKLLNLKQLEKEFLNELKSVRAEIDIHLVAAESELEEAVNLSEQHGIPFSSYLYKLPQSRQYYPSSFNNKYGKLDRDWLWDQNIDSFALTGWEFWNSSQYLC